MIRENPPSELRIDESLTLRRLQLGNSGLVFRAIDTDREHLRRWLPFVDDTRKAEDTEIFIKSILHTDCPRKDLIYEIWYKSEFAGLIALKEIDGWNKKTEVGYWIISKLQGLGIVTKSCEELINLAFNQMGMNRMQLKAAVGNARSSMVAERLHFKFEGIERAGELHHGKYFNLLVYSILKKEWQASRQ
jgi:ribosomal-protein-serine acetyltransferase